MQAAGNDRTRADEARRRGVELAATGDLDGAGRAFADAISLAPDAPLPHRDLANVRFDQGDYAAATRHYRQSIALTAPDDERAFELHVNVGACLELLDRQEEAIDCYRVALRLNPACVQAHVNLREVFRRSGREVEADFHQAALNKLESGPALRLRAALDLPVILADVGAADRLRAHLSTELERIAATGAGVIGHPETAINATPLYLAYHGRDDAALLRKLAMTIRGFMPAREHRPGVLPAANRRIRIGFVSTFFYNHSIGRLNRGLIAALSRDRFEVHVFAIDAPDDETARLIGGMADSHHPLPNNVNAVAHAIEEAALDVLYYPEIGLHPTPYYLAFHRLAPLQCVSYGHPMTTGIDTIDYFLSASDLEPAGAQSLYTEPLVALGGFFVPAYERPRFDGPPADRAQFGALTGQRVYFCPQTLFKIHPDFDHALAAILRRDPAGIVVLLEGSFTDWTAALRRRFSRSMPDVQDRVRFIPQRGTAAYFALLRAADVVLDTFHFGGGISALDIFAAGAPVATLAGAYFRGRQAAAAYAEMGMADCVSHSVEAYVESALRLAGDHDHHAAVARRIDAASDRLFNRMEAVRSLEQFLERQVRATAD